MYIVKVSRKKSYFPNTNAVVLTHYFCFLCHNSTHTFLQYIVQWKLEQISTKNHKLAFFFGGGVNCPHIPIHISVSSTYLMKHVSAFEAT